MPRHIQPARQEIRRTRRKSKDSNGFIVRPGDLMFVVISEISVKLYVKQNEFL